MKQQIVMAAGLAAALVCGTAFSQDGGRDDEQGGVDELKELVEAQALRIDELEEELLATQARLDETIAYLHANAKQADAMLGTFQASEAAGFTKGINWESREMLLAGFREYMSGQKSGLPKAPPPKPQPTPPKR